MTNTQGLDALAALCGEENASAANNPAPPATAMAPQAGVGAGPSNLAIYAQQQQMQQQAQAQALQMQQQVQHALAVRQAAAAQAQQQQVAAAGAGLPQNLAAIQQAQQLQSIMAAQQQQQHHQATAAFGQVQQAQAQAIAAQIVAAQQQQQQHIHPGLTALPPASLAGFAATGGQVIPGAATLPQLASTSPALSMSPALQVANTAQISSPSTLAMPPPPTKVVPGMPMSNNPGKATKSARRSSGSSASDKLSSSGPAASKASRRNSGATLAASAQPPIHDIISEWEDKKLAKRAANRLSAHLSRKRKKMFIEDLKDENVELRRKEQILRSIPDLIVVFDSSGSISFVSHSVTRFLDYTVEELTGTSFWECLTVDSVRLIKSAFMDALAVKRPPDEDSAPLAGGESVTVTLVHKKDGEVDDDEGLPVSLKGVVHFAGESPECVCSIRPESGAAKSSSQTNKKQKAAAKEPPSVPLKKRAAAASAMGAPTHQISDIDSEQS